MKAILPYMVKREIKIKRKPPEEEVICTSWESYFTSSGPWRTLGGEQRAARDVASVTLELGQVSGAVPRELESCWNWAAARTELMPRAALRIETVHAITHCDGCGRDYRHRTPRAGCAPTAAARTPGWCRGTK